MARVRYVTAAGALVALALRTSGDEVRYVPSQQMLLSLATDNPRAITSIELWVTANGGQVWRCEPTERAGDILLRFRAPTDGRFGFFVILGSDAGPSAQSPPAGIAPQVECVVDTVPPTLQLHAAEVDADRADRQLRLRVSVLDENLGPSGLRVFYRASANGAWRDGGTAALAGNEINWRVPSGVAGILDIRVTATDLAGNRAWDEIQAVHVPADDEENALGRDSLAEPTTQPASDETPVASVTRAEPTQTSTSFNQVERLKRLAQRHMAERQYSLAAARLEDAARLAPQDGDVLVDLASALYQSGRYADAEARLAAAVQAAPDHLRAVEGLALVAATQRRYPAAREHLLHLLRLEPGSAVTWLRYGDIEHRLGNVEQAAAAWRRVLELQDPDGAVRDKAAKRLKYFAPDRRRQP